MDTTRKHERQFPLKKLEGLVKIAIENNLDLLQVGDIRIVPRPKFGSYTPAMACVPREEDDGAPKRELTTEEIRDEILFGQGGSLRIDE